MTSEQETHGVAWCSFVRRGGVACDHQATVLLDGQLLCPEHLRVMRRRAAAAQIARPTAPTDPVLRGAGEAPC